MTRDLPKYVHRRRTRHGREVIHFSRTGRAPYIRIREEVGSPEFFAVYAQLLKGEPVALVSAPKLELASPQTFRWVCVQYAKSDEFNSRDKAILDSCCQEPVKSSKPKGAKYADLPLKELTFEHLVVLRSRKNKAGLPEAANGRVKALRRLFKWARLTHPKDFPINLAADLSKVKGHADKGFKLWTPADIEAFEERHPVGTRARLAFDIFRYLGCARVDAVKVGWPMVETVHGKRIVHFKRAKTDVESNPLLTEGLVATINATPKVGIRTWLVTEYGKPFSAAGFGNWFRDRCIEAGILDPKKRAHAIRHSAATIDAENGATAHQLMAKYGWRTLAMAQKYCDRADRRRLAASMG